jgi:DNA polymerase (family X)
MKMHKGMTNLEVARLLRSVAAALSVKPGSPTTRFRIIAFNNAADAIEHATSEVKDLWDDNALDQIPGVGKGIARDLDELFKTGTVQPFEEIMEGLPPAMFELMDVPGIGAKRAYRLTTELGIEKAEDAFPKLKEAAEKGEISKLEGFGEKIEKEILESLGQVKERNRRLLLPHATVISEEIIEWMKKCPQSKKVETLGSLRRRVSTIGDIDIAVATDDGEKVIKHFTEYPKKVKLIEAGPFSSSMLLAGGVQVDLMVQPEEYFGALLQHFTGSKHHNVALRTYALKHKWSLSERGIKEDGEIKHFKTEEEFYKFLKMDWIPPEIREDKGEIQAALNHKLPNLVELRDIKGDLHMHTNFPEETSHDIGAHSQEVMAEGGVKLGYQYMGFTEHNLKSSLPEEKVFDVLKKKQEKIQKLNEKVKLHVFNGLEVDIQPNGSISLPEKGFDYLDYAIVSLHSSFRGKTREEQTKRVLEGLSHPKVRIFGHPTGRKLQEREGIDLNWEQIFDFALKNNKWIEINCSPDRLDLPDSLVYEAVKKGVRLIIDTDSHDVSWLVGMRYGVDVARRGWAEKKDIMNTLSLKEFKKLLESY